MCGQRGGPYFEEREVRTIQRPLSQLDRQTASLASVAWRDTLSCSARRGNLLSDAARMYVNSGYACVGGEYAAGFCGPRMTYAEPGHISSSSIGCRPGNMP